MAKKLPGTAKPKKSKKKNGPAKGEGGRPVIEIDYTQAEKLAALHCTQVEIAGFFGMGIESLRNRIKDKYGLTYHQWFEQFSAPGKISLRRKQYEVAMKENPQMLKHLGAQWLGQTDKAEIKTESKGQQFGTYEEFIIARAKEIRKQLEQDKSPEQIKNVEEAEVISYDVKKLINLKEENPNEQNPVQSRQTKASRS